MQSSNQIIGITRGLVGAAIGGAVGYFAFGWILNYRLYAMILPGAALGFGFATLAGERNTVNGIISAVLATGLALFTEWKHFPFDADESLGFFLRHIHKLTPVAFPPLIDPQRVRES